MHGSDYLEAGFFAPFMTARRFLDCINRGLTNGRLEAF